MPRGFVDNSEGDVADEEVDDGGFGDDILAADADGVDVLLLNVGQHHATAVADDLCRGIDDKGVGCVPEPLLHVRSERLLAFIRKGDIALGDGDGVHGLAVQQQSSDTRSEAQVWRRSWNRISRIPYCFNSFGKWEVI